MVLPFGRRRNLRRNEFGPAATSPARGVHAGLPRVFAGALAETRHVLRRELSQAVAALRADLRQEQGFRRGREGGFARALQGFGRELGELRARVDALENPGSPADPDPGAPARLYAVPGPRRTQAEAEAEAS